MRKATAPRWPARLALAAAGLVPLLAPAVVHAATPSYSTSLLHFSVHVGPSGTESCDIVGEMFQPAGASARHPVPAVLTTNGFGGSYTDQEGLAAYLASNGYAVLTYSGLGFGGSGCQITLDDPLYDGLAASQLVSYLGGAPGIAFTDAAHTHPAPVVGYVIHDARDHLGRADRYDPRVGMIGGSYGGEIQFAAAYEDPRIDTIIPLITWNDLDYSLAPNNAGLPLTSVSNALPGAVKSTWATGFSAEGMADGLTGAQADPSRLVGCPNFASWVCPGLAFAAATGYPAPSTRAYLRHASVANYISGIDIPTLLMQGENDTLFNLHEAVATFSALQARHVPVSMVWQSWGHSGSTPAPGELDLNHPDAATQYETARILDWFDHWLKGDPKAPIGPTFAYFEDWVAYKGIATPAYGTSSTYPVGRTVPLYLSASSALVGDPRLIGVSDQRFVTPAGGVPTSTGPVDAVGGSLPSQIQGSSDAPGTYAYWMTAPLPSPLDVAGIPVLHLTLGVPALGARSRIGPAGDLVIFAKIYDRAPDGSVSLIHGLVSPARIDSATGSVEITLPGIVHRFAAGHRVELVIAGGDPNYRGGAVATAVDIRTGDPGQVLDLPVISG